EKRDSKSANAGKPVSKTLSRRASADTGLPVEGPDLLGHCRSTFGSRLRRGSSPSERSLFCCSELTHVRYQSLGLCLINALFLKSGHMRRFLAFLTVKYRSHMFCVRQFRIE